MFRKILFLLSFSLLASNAVQSFRFAEYDSCGNLNYYDQHHYRRNSKCGPSKRSNGLGHCAYIGVSGGVGNLNGEYRSLDRITSEVQKFRLGPAYGLIGGVFGVQTILCNEIYFALQVNALYSSLDSDILSTTAFASPIYNKIVNLKNKAQYGVDVRLGFSCLGFTPYFFGGIETGTWDVYFTNQTGGNFQGIPAHTKLHFDKTRCGPRFGLGVAFPFSCRFSGNLEYSYSGFNKISIDLLIPSTGHIWNHHFTINQNAFIANLNYLF